MTPTGAFTVSSSFAWDISELYTTGEVTLAAAPSLLGDYNANGAVDAADYVVGRDGLGSVYTKADYNVWRANFGETAGSGAVLGSSSNTVVPEPATLLLLMFSAKAVLG